MDDAIKLRPLFVSGFESKKAVGIEDSRLAELGDDEGGGAEVVEFSVDGGDDWGSSVRAWRFDPDTRGLKAETDGEGRAGTSDDGSAGERRRPDDGRTRDGFAVARLGQLPDIVRVERRPGRLAAAMIPGLGDGATDREIQQVAERGTLHALKVEEATELAAGSAARDYLAAELSTKLDKEVQRSVRQRFRRPVESDGGLNGYRVGAGLLGLVVKGVGRRFGGGLGGRLVVEGNVRQVVGRNDREGVEDGGFGVRVESKPSGAQESVRVNLERGAAGLQGCEPPCQFSGGAGWRASLVGVHPGCSLPTAGNAPARVKPWDDTGRL